MREDVRQALAIDASSTIEERTIDITTTGRRTGAPRRIEIVLYRLGDDLYLSGIPAPRTRDWLANLVAEPHLTIHLKRDIVADLPATATVIVDPAERRRVRRRVQRTSRHRQPMAIRRPRRLGGPQPARQDQRQYSPLITKYDPRMVPASFDF
jgi:deazaflavin-dependent oxidoreductase (nitroreductase family)